MPRKKKAVKEPIKEPTIEVIKETPLKPLEKKSYFNKRVYVEYICPNCNSTYKEMAIGNAIIIQNAQCAKCLCLMKKKVTDK